MLLGRSLPLADAEDVAQEAFWLLSRAVHDGRLRLPDSDEGVMSLLKTIARNSAKDLLRREHRQRRDTRRRVAWPDEEIASSETVSPQSRLERQELVEALLDLLEPFDRQLLERLIAGDSLEEIAGKVGKSVKTIRRHHRFIQELADGIEAASEINRPP
jgi:RNA polymerase sigma factor (sigma-70 family)